ncbi:MAG: bifunctional phosphoribosyl-AMP cyclohydrolase/phosphoribosyl-ATP diphosphatase HisIE [Candidatus Gracilibacteria bacterium]|jgi:phosphoribosyl-ATP pyrophosphohydrolase/phosphoribosyl-AMP cyclohydrolase|nr:bifunctional phosphoribosyl-AMP cyclohydrolase/phosphoribosyl-ATP diphosphatase HisIE [Candidatus Gracilibacteria bacterium]
MKLNFDKMNGLIPCIVQDLKTNQVLMLGFMNQEAYNKTIKESKVCFYSRTKKRLWQKGEGSGNHLIVKEILTDCDNDTLLIKAEAEGATCHTGAYSCFGEEEFSLKGLEKIIEKRKNSQDSSSYTKSLFEEGLDRIIQKVGEEAIEVVIASKNEDDEDFKNETSDLLYHLIVLLQAKGMRLEDIEKTLELRHKK